MQILILQVSLQYLSAHQILGSTWYKFIIYHEHFFLGRNTGSFVCFLFFFVVVFFLQCVAFL